jgi:hypothetical protein
MKRLFGILRRSVGAMALALLLVVFSSSCSRIKDIRLASCSVESVSPIGLHGLSAELAVQIENPAMQFSLSDIQGTLFHKGNPIIVYDAEPIEVAGHSVAVYPLPCTATLSPGVRLMDIISLMRGYDVNDFTMDVSAKVRLRSGLSKTLRFKDIPVKDLLE